MANWEDILCPCGWTISYTRGDTTYWQKPNSNDGSHATTGWKGSNTLHIFSTACSPLEANETYNKFACYTLLYHKGDYKAAYQELRKTI
jgi:hypothetical protein